MVALRNGMMIAATLLLAACGAATPRSEPARVHFVIEPETARVYTDDAFVGGARVLAARPKEFRPGPRRFTITADGYFPHDLEVDLAPGSTTVEVRLRPVPP